MWTFNLPVHIERIQTPDEERFIRTQFTPMTGSMSSQKRIFNVIRIIKVSFHSQGNKKNNWEKYIHLVRYGAQDLQVSKQEYAYNLIHVYKKAPLVPVSE